MGGGCCYTLYYYILHTEPGNLLVYDAPRLPKSPNAREEENPLIIIIKLY